MLWQLPHFQVRFRGRDVFSISTARSGVSYAPILEWVLAARWAGYTYEQFEKMDGDRQSFYVAARRAELQIEAVMTKEANKKAKQK